MATQLLAVHNNGDGTYQFTWSAVTTTSAPAADANVLGWSTGEQAWSSMGPVAVQLGTTNTWSDDPFDPTAGDTDITLVVILQTPITVFPPLGGQPIQLAGPIAPVTT